jgi:hypothetical protein
MRRAMRSGSRNEDGGQSFELGEGFDPYQLAGNVKEKVDPLPG